MKPLQYVTAQTPESAISHAKSGGRFFAGGIDVLGEWKEGISDSALLVNVKALPNTDQIAFGEESVRIGTNVLLSNLASNDEIIKRLPGLAQAASEVGSPQIRNVATVGGNLAQHSRCWYYRHRDVECLKNGGDTCYARRGENRYHNLFSDGPCVSPVVSNLSIALTSLDARVHIMRDSEEIQMPVEEMYRDAWFNPRAHNGLRQGDLILAVSVPYSRQKSSYMQLSDKSSFDWALVSCSAAADVSDGKLVRPRVTLGVVAPGPYRKTEVDAFLEGKSNDPSILNEAASMMLADAEALEHNGYKIPVAKALVRRCLAALFS